MMVSSLCWLNARFLDPLRRGLPGWCEKATRWQFMK
jgi:hypothetical protein